MTTSITEEIPSKIRLISVCVQYDDLLSLSLPSWLPHVDEILIVTAPSDQKTLRLVDQYSSKVRHFKTDAFYQNGAKFNKGLAIEEGFDVLGREGWILIADSDIVFPESMSFPDLEIGKLYTPRRRILTDLKYAHQLNSINGSVAPVRPDVSHYGYFQLFHADSPQLKNRPWYTTDWTHAGGADNDFQNKFSPEDKIWIDSFTVLHLGPCDENWFGRSTKRIDDGSFDRNADSRRLMQEKLKRKHGWGRRWTGEQMEERIK